MDTLVFHRCISRLPIKKSDRTIVCHTVVTGKCALNTKMGAAPFGATPIILGSLVGWLTGLEAHVAHAAHSAHSAHATHIGHCGGAATGTLFGRLVSDHGFGRDQQTGDGGRIL